VITLIGIIAVSFGIQIFMSKPDFGAMALGCLPSPEILHNPAPDITMWQKFRTHTSCLVPFLGSQAQVRYLQSPCWHRAKTQR
jgi:hypothetical protein